MGVERRRRSITRPDEHGHHRIAFPLFVRSHTTVSDDHVIENLIVSFNGRCHADWVSLPQRSGPLDVGQQKRHRARRQRMPRHQSTPSERVATIERFWHAVDHHDLTMPDSRSDKINRTDEIDTEARMNHLAGK